MTVSRLSIIFAVDAKDYTIYYRYEGIRLKDVPEGG